MRVSIKYVQIKKVKVKWPRFRPGVAQRVGRGIALFFPNRGTKRGWVVNSTPRPHFTPGKDIVPILQEAGWSPGVVWTGGKSRPQRDSIPDSPARSQSLYDSATGPTFVQISHVNPQIKINYYVYDYIRTRQSGFRIPTGARGFLLHELSRTALGSTEPPIQWVR